MKIQTARVSTFDAATIPYIDWNVIGRTRFELGCDLMVERIGPPGAYQLKVTFFWLNND